MITAYDLVTEVIGSIEHNEDITMKTISITTQKGGVSKTTSALTLSAGLTERGYRVLLVDADAQRNSSITLRADENKPNILSVLTGEATAKEAIQHSPTADFIGGSKQLSLIDDIITEEDKFTRLRDALKAVSRAYDFAIIDTPPALGTATLNALYASDYVLVPALAEYYSATALVDLAKTVYAVKNAGNSKLKILGVFFTMHNKRTKLSREFIDEFKQVTDALDTSLFDATIRDTKKARELQLKPQGLFKYAPRHGLTQDYNELIDELLNRLES